MTMTAVQPVRVYADTSVYGGVFDEEFATPSRRFFDRVREGRFMLVVSRLVEDELRKAPPLLHRRAGLEIRSPLEVIEDED